jgi:hypothetical protein
MIARAVWVVPISATQRNPFVPSSAADRIVPRPGCDTHFDASIYPGWASSTGMPEGNSTQFSLCAAQIAAFGAGNVGSVKQPTEMATSSGVASLYQKTLVT